MSSYSSGVHRDLRVGLVTRIGIGIDVEQKMFMQLNAVVLEAAEALAEKETPGNGE